MTTPTDATPSPPPAEPVSPWSGLVDKLAKLNFAVPVPLPSESENVGGDTLIGTIKKIDRGVLTIECAHKINTRDKRVLAFTLLVPEMLLRAALVPEDRGPALSGLHI